MRKTIPSILILLLFMSMILIHLNCSQDRKENKTASPQDLISRGKYLVTFGGCNDCHTPKVFTQKGPVLDTTKLLSGHQAGSKYAVIDTSVTNSKWVYTSLDLTTWVGPWGVSFPANLTPDEATGLGNWTDEIFIKAMRTGKHMGFGRDILPPMPWFSLAALNDEDLKAILAYLKSIKPIVNQVPDPIPPNMIIQATASK